MLMTFNISMKHRKGKKSKVKTLLDIDKAKMQSKQFQEKGQGIKFMRQNFVQSNDINKDPNFSLQQIYYPGARYNCKWKDIDGLQSYTKYF